MSENIFICPDCNDANKTISSIDIHKGKIIFDCNHEIDLENYKNDLMEKKNLDTSNDKKIKGKIGRKMKSLSDLIRVIYSVLKTHENYYYNYMNTKNVIKLGQSIEEEEKIPSNIDDTIKKIFSKKKIEEEKKALEILKGEDYYIDVDGDNEVEEEENGDAEKEEKEEEEEEKKNLIEEEKKSEKKELIEEEKKPKKKKIKLNERKFLILKGKYKSENGKVVKNGDKKESDYENNVKICIGNEGFELISKVIFKNLIDINLSCNGISSVEYLDKMLLPHLEYLDLSNNEIGDVKPVATLKSKHLRIILLQDNYIKSLEPFKDKEVNFEELIYLRVDNNKFNEKDVKKDKDLEKKFGKKLIYKTLDTDSFCKKYDINFNLNDDKLDLSDRKKKELLMDLFLLIGFQFNIKYLDLENNYIDNASILSSIPLFKLEVLDLALNRIPSILFLRKLSKKCPELRELYLHDNKIVDITLFKDFTDGKNSNIFQKLRILTLKNNPFYHEEKNGNKTNKEDKKDKKSKEESNDENKKDKKDKKSKEESNDENKKIENKEIIISIKDGETREVFKKIMNKYTTDFGEKKYIKIKEEEEEKRREKEKKRNKTKKNDDLIDDSNTINQLNGNTNNIN